MLLIVDTGETRTGRRPVSVVCIRGDAADADTNTRLMYKCVVSVTTPPGRVGGDTGLIERTCTLGSWDYPANVDLENPWHPLPVDAVHGDSKEVHLDIRIIKLNVDHLSLLSVIRCLSMWRLPCKILLYWSIPHE